MENRLQMLYNEYMDEKRSDECHTEAHQKYMKNLAVEMAAIEYLMKSDIAEHVHMAGAHKMSKQIQRAGSKLDRAVASRNWKWVMYELVSIEIHNIEKYLNLSDLAKADLQAELAAMFMSVAESSNDIAMSLVKKYSSMLHTSGTTNQRIQWDEEFTELMKRHSAAVKRLEFT